MVHQTQTYSTRPARLGTIPAVSERRADGSVLLRLLEPLAPYPQRLTERLIYWAQHAPDRTFLAERDGLHSWRRMSFADTLRRVRAVGQALLDRGLSQDSPVMILSENDLDNAVLALACLHVGVPYVPMSPAYALLSQDFARLRHRAALCRPGLVFAADGQRYGPAVSAVFPNVEFVVSAAPPQDRAATPFAVLLATIPTAAVDAAHRATGLDTVGKIIFTSGTAGAPKGVVLSQRMLCSNRQQVVQHLPFLEEEPAVQVDWLPWHHTFGGTHNVGIALYSGGSLYIDPGRPTADGIGKTIAALTEIAPTFYQGTPQTFAALLPHLRSNAVLRRSFFSKLKLIYYGGAVMPEHLWEALDDVAITETGHRIMVVSGLGSTETGPTPIGTNWDPQRKSVAGLPLPGCELKIVPVGNRLEVRVRGPNVTPGYWRDPERTEAAFDDEGFFCMGDAVTFIDPQRPEAGIRFDGRLSENFKLLSGTWVDVAEIRERAIAAFAPLARDVVVCGEGRDHVAALVFPEADPLPGEELQVRALFQERLDALAAGMRPSMAIRRIAIEAEPALLDTGELTAKMTISQTAVRARRADAIEDLFRDDPPPRILVARLPA